MKTSLRLSLCTASLSALLLSHMAEARGGGRLNMNAEGELVTPPETNDGGGSEGGAAKLDRNGNLVIAGKQAPASVEGASSEVTRDGRFPDLQDLRTNVGNSNSNPNAAAAAAESKPNDEGGDDQILELPFHCGLDIDFFEGHGREPTEEEVEQLVKKTDLWLSDLFGMDDTFEEYNIHDDYSTLYDPDFPDFFHLDFVSAAHILQNGDTSMTIDDIANLVDHADYESYITHYIWRALPYKQNEFYQTHMVTLGCAKGLPPAADGFDRRLRGAAAAAAAAATKPTTTFGGSHSVLDHHNNNDNKA